MGMMTKLLTAGALAAAMTAGDAQAATVAGTISTGDGNSALVPLGLGNSLSGYYGGQIALFGGPADIEVTYLGNEAGFTNTFKMISGIFSAEFTTAGKTDTFDPNEFQSITLLGVASGLLNFAFSTPTSGVTNGSNTDNLNPSVPNFFASFLPNASFPFGQGVLLFLDDGAGDLTDNHDDMVVRLRIVGGTGQLAPVPVPAAGFLLIGALGGLAALRRRKKV